MNTLHGCKRLVAGVSVIAGFFLPISLSVDSVQAASPAPYFLQVNKSDALRSTPAYARNIEVSESKGTLLWVLSGTNSRWWRVQDQNGHVGYVVKNQQYVSAAAVEGATPDVMAWNQTTSALPPAVSVDSAITPLAGKTSSWASKFAAVMFVAQSKLGTPYRLYHNEDRGQFGFDCSNYTAYVFHHALGMKFSGASQAQYKSVGWTVPSWSMRPGDLLIFDHGAHVGIYVGNQQMIEEGGGLGKVGYLSIAPGSTWGDKLTCVKRLF